MSLRGIWSGWERFWFTPAPTSTLALVRIAFGLLSLAWTLALIGDLFAFFSEDGVIGTVGHQADWHWSLFDISDSGPVLVGGWLVLMASSIALILGYRARVAALLVFVLNFSFQLRAPWVFNAGDTVIRILALGIMFAPSGASLSLDRLRKTRDRFWEFPLRTMWSLRFLQVQMSIIYFCSVWYKAQGPFWNDGIAITYSERVGHLERYPVPGIDVVTISNLLTYGALATEFAIAILVWNRKARPWVLLLGVMLHLGIDYSLRIGFFSYAMLVLYVAFIPPERASDLILRSRDWLRRRLGPPVPGATGRPADVTES